ncbi:MAG TPA: TerB family tellurite resistance protein [Bryobacteraceae bacterium]|nr:TerB family tellurite resistance protein [Bryobacteraceae bacterium]
MSIREFLGIPEKHTTGETETVRKVIEALDQIEPDRARFMAAFGYILGRVANADLKISPEETRAMERIIMERGALPEEQALIVVQTAKTRTQLFGGTENFLVTREFSRIATREEKLALLDCLFAVAAAEGGISTTEDNEIRQIVNELGLGHPDFIAVRSRWKDQLTVFRQG